uniref:Glutamyl-tRNA(Gln) amidotransferase subunit A, mitochondrial n=1 Tax=Steinernema glaseri TaxID=37863 RepID=A0A1I7YDR6_9BILA
MKCVEEAIERAVKHRHLNCLITETFQLALDQASEAQKKGLKPFPVIVKDCFAVKNVPMTCSSKMLLNYSVPYTATVVKRLVKSGGCIIGKSNLDEFSMGSSSLRGYFGPVKSGFSHKESLDDDWVVAGGSSGGSAVGVQLGMATVALGSDTGGSARNPAAFNGVFGFKPTYGLLSRNGLVPLTNSLDAPSIIAKSADDCKTYLDVMKGHDPFDSTTVDSQRCIANAKQSLKGLVIGIPQEYFNDVLSPTVLRALNSSALELEKAGCTIKEVSMKHTEQSIVCYHILGECDVASNMGRYDGVSYGFRKLNETSLDAMYTASRNRSLNKVVKNRIIAGNYFLLKENRKKYYDAAVRLRRLIAGDFKRAFSPDGEGVHALLTPVTSDSAESYKHWKKERFQRDWVDDFYTQPANMAGVPALSVPVGFCKKKRPVGVQLISNLFEDDLCLSIGKELYRLMGEPQIE